MGTTTSLIKESFNRLENAVDELKDNAVSSAIIILSINHNLAVICALQGQFDEAHQRLSACIKAAEKIYFDIDLQGQSGLNKPAIRELYDNLQAVIHHMEEKRDEPDPYAFLLQF